MGKLRTFVNNLVEPAAKEEDVYLPTDEDLDVTKKEIEESGWTPPTADQLGDDSKVRHDGV